MAEQLHLKVRPGSEKARIWSICDALYAERGEIPTGREVVDRYLSESGNKANEGTGFTQYSHWKKAVELANSDEPRLNDAPRMAQSVTPPADSSAETDGFFPLTVAPDGRLVLPPALVAAMMLDQDGRVTAHVEEGELKIISPRAAIRRIQRIARKYKKPGESVVDELIADRRAEAAREEAEP